MTYFFKSDAKVRRLRVIVVTQFGILVITLWAYKKQY